MKISFALLFAMMTISLSAQIYVDQHAIGNDDGSSWQNAYTNLQSALDQPNNDDIWIASGEYFPNQIGNDAYFLMNEAHNMYGGFNGTESSNNEADPLTNIVTINGDFNGDDIEDNFIENRQDNALHLLLVPGGFNQIVIRGIHFTGGSSSTDGDDLEIETNGGAILSYSPLHVESCHFTNNVARAGGCIYIEGTAENKIINCSFDANRGTSQSAGIMMNSCTSSMIDGCNFNENLATRGGLYTLYCKDIEIANCVFDSNESPEEDWGCAGYFNWNSEDIILRNTDFTHHVAGNASAIYIDGRDTTYNNVTFINCNIENNACTNYGGAVYCWQGVYTMNDCSFNENMAPNASGLYNGGAQFTINNTVFSNHVANFGGGSSNYTSSIGSYNDCAFDSNLGNTSGAACMVGFLGDVTFNGCKFNNNTAQFGGAVYIQNDTTSAHFYQCSFEENRADFFGGAVNSSGDNNVSYSESDFIVNLAEFGAAISCSGDSLKVFDLRIDRCFFNTNYASLQGGGLNLNNKEAIITSSVFINNGAQNEGNGGAIANNAFDGNFSKLDITNCTIAKNEGALAGGIMQYQDSTGQASMDIRNTILWQETFPDYTIEEGTPYFNSFGGNLVYQTDLEEYLIGNNDAIGLDPMFKSNSNFELLEGSPAIDTGVEDGAASTDFLGATAVGIPDKGAYEFGGSGVGTKDYIIENQHLHLLENPAKNMLSFYLSNMHGGLSNVRIIDLQANKIYSSNFNILENEIQSLNIANLIPGNYILQITNGRKMMTKKFIKLQ